MFSLIVRGLLIVAGIVTSWLVAKNEPLFSVIQMTIAILLITFVLLVAAFWPASWTKRLNRAAKPPPPQA